MPLFRRPQHGSLAPEPAGGYERSLALIGRHLDIRKCRAAAVLEVTGGYIVRAIAADDVPTLLEFVSDDFANWGAPAVPKTPATSDLLAAGYEATFRVIGRRLDDRTALAIALIETPMLLHIIAYEGGHAGGQWTHLPFEESFDEWTLRALTDGTA